MRFSRELYKIVSINTRMPQPMYQVESMNDHRQLKRNYYFEQLQRAVGDEVFKVEDVLKERIGEDGQKELFVKWLNFDAKHNSWIKASDVIADYRPNQQ